MKTIVSLFLTFFILNVTFAQERPLKLIEKKKYDKANRLIKKKLKDEPDNVLLNFAFAKLFGQQEFRKNNFETAYYYINRTENLFSNLDDKSKKEIQDVVTYDIIRKSIYDICTNAFDEIRKINKTEIYNHYIAYYSKAGTLLKSAEYYRDRSAYNDAALINSIDAYQKYIDTYPNAEQNNLAVKSRDKIAYSIAFNKNTINSFDYFITTYPQAIQIPDAVFKRDSIVYINVLKINTVASFDDFISKYPNSSFKPEAVSLRDNIAFKMCESDNTSKSYLDFIKSYPNSDLYDKAKYRYQFLLVNEIDLHNDVEGYINLFERQKMVNLLSPMLEDSLIRISVNKQNIKGVEYYYNNCVNCVKNDSLNNILFDVYTNDGHISSVENFEDKYPELIRPELIIKSKAIAYEGNELLLDYYRAVSFNKPQEKILKQFDLFIRKSSPKQTAYNMILILLKPYIKSKNYSNALNVLNNYSKFYSSEDVRIKTLREALTAKLDPSIQVKSIGVNINSKGEEYCPIISGDNRTIYFCGRNRKDNIGGEDIFTCNLNDGSTPQILSDLCSAYSNDATESVSIDGTQMLLFKNANLYTSNKTIYGWSEAVSVDKVKTEDNSQTEDEVGDYISEDNGIINTENFEADAMISSDGKVLIFTSDRPGGIGLYHKKDRFYSGTFGNIDIYVSMKNEKGSWSQPINIGSTINTPFIDRSPFLHPDMKTLYFSSDGHGTLGGLDVYKSTRLYDTSWLYWSEPQNMGKDINTEQDDWGYRISTDGEKAYFSKRVPVTDQDIFYLNLPPRLRPNYVATISGRLVDRNKKPVTAKIKWEDLETGKNVGESKSDPSTGDFFIVLPLGRIYGYYIDKQEYFPVSNNLDLRRQKQAIEVEKTIDLISFKEMVDEGIAVPVNNLFFYINDKGLLPPSLPELKRVAQIIKSRNLKVEISGHTDSTGTVELNQKLSEQRAIAVKDFLVKEGCSQDLFTTIGYGDKRPLSDNITDEGRARNRRVELRFTK